MFQTTNQYIYINIHQVPVYVFWISLLLESAMHNYTHQQGWAMFLLLSPAALAVSYHTWTLSPSANNFNIFYNIQGHLGDRCGQHKRPWKSFVWIALFCPW
jgi:hypothetical protein